MGHWFEQRLPPEPTITVEQVSAFAREIWVTQVEGAIEVAKIQITKVPEQR
jgi:hypothetical protein